MAKILLVEDNEMNRDMLSRRLIKRGYEVVMAVDGQAGIDMAVNEKPDLILLDMSLPVVDGWEAAKQIKANEASRAVPLIALIAQAMASDKERALSAGWYVYGIGCRQLCRHCEACQWLHGLDSCHTGLRRSM